MRMIQEIFNDTDIYLNDEQYKALSLISKCRTGSLGYHTIECKDCTHKSYYANSCRNRNCPICQHKAQHDWINSKKQIALNCRYYHIVATIPQVLYQIFLQNKKIMYEILLKSSANAILELLSDKKYLGAKVGIIQILHTWNQVIGYHPHAHMLVTAGGIDELNRWVEKDGDFIIPVKVLSAKYRGKFISLLKEKQDKLNLSGKLEKYLTEKGWKSLIDELYKSAFVTFIKEPYDDANIVIEYFGRYTHRIAIAESRILEYKDGKVTFSYHDRKDNNKIKNLTLTKEAFTKRFAMHVLPKGFRKIRCYGIFCNRKLKERINNIKIIIKNTMNRESLKVLIENICAVKCRACNSKNIEFNNVDDKKFRSLKIVKLE